MKVQFNGKTLVTRFERYNNNSRLALLLETENGSPYAHATVNLVQYLVPRDRVFIRNSDAYAGMLDALQAAGIATPVGETGFSGFESYPLVQLTDAAKEEIEIKFAGYFN